MAKEPAMSVAARTHATELSFIRKTHFEMNKPMRKIAGDLDEVIDHLLRLCGSTDNKIALAAMKTLLDYYSNAVNMKNQDEIERLKAQVAMKGMLNGSLVPGEDDDMGVPFVNFNTILEIDD